MKLTANLALLLVVPQSTTCRATVCDDTVQLDLIFPPNNTVHQPVYPFPIVIGLSNAKDTWRHRYHVRWELQVAALDHDRSYTAVDEGSFSPNHAFPDDIEEPKVDRLLPPDQWILAHGTEKLINTTHSHFRLALEVRVIDARERDEGTGVYMSPHTVAYEGHVFFHLSDEGVLPDVSAMGPCSEHLTTFRYRDEVEYHDGGAIECPLMDEQDLIVVRSEILDACASQVKKEVGKQVVDVMLRMAGCEGTNATWPNVTRRGWGDCSTPGDDGRENGTSGTYTVPAMVGSWISGLVIVAAIGWAVGMS